MPVRATDLGGVHVLKHENLFLLSDDHGDAFPDGRGLGLYDGDTRLLSLYRFAFNSLRPVILRAAPAAAHQGVIHLTNPELLHGGPGDDGSEVVLNRQSLGIVRTRVMAEGRMVERITVHNYTRRPQTARLSLELDADFADVFELRGFVRERRGERLPPKVNGGHVVFGYRGLDGVLRRTHVEVRPAMRVLASSGSDVSLELKTIAEPGVAFTLEVEIWGEEVGAHAEPADAGGPQGSIDEAVAMHRAWRSSSTIVETRRALVERALERANSDVRLLVNRGPGAGEHYVAAGVPWFSCLFGRDSIITSLQLLAIRPQIAEWTLSVLGRLQATQMDEWRDAQPGKILHELRTGELARTGEIPHTPYYGTVDATPLWLVLLNEYERWTADMALVDRLWPNALAALNWIDTYGDSNGDGFVDYQRQSRGGLSNQGWKDSGDAIRNRDGSLAEAPISLVEVQGYVYAARRGLARLARRRGDEDLARRQEAAADDLRERFEAAFWMEEAGTYAMALDGRGRQVDATASNAGHALWTGIASNARARRVAHTLTSGGMWSGWGIRTLSNDMLGYNPIGYHLGTVWPHDNGICAAGFARYGLFDETVKVTGALLEATPHFRDSRLPELFCGFDRESSSQPVPYPVACSPQAWAAGSVFHLLSATLGLTPSAHERRLELLRPALPDWLPELRLRNMRIGDALVDLQVASHAGTTSVEVLNRTGDLDVLVSL